MSRRVSLGGFSTDAAASAQVRAPNLIPFPQGSIHRAPLKSSDIRNATFEIAALVFAFLFVTVTGFGLALSVFVLLFIEV